MIGQCIYATLHIYFQSLDFMINYVKIISILEPYFLQIKTDGGGWETIESNLPNLLSFQKYCPRIDYVVNPEIQTWGHLKK